MKFATLGFMDFQKTLVREQRFEGVGLHSGEDCLIVLHPEEENTGIRFLVNRVYIPADYRHVLTTDHATVLGSQGEKIGTVEHLLGVLYMLGVDNLTIEVIRGREVPILDGSGFDFYMALKDEVVDLQEEAKHIHVSSSLMVKNCKGYIRIDPFDGFHASYRGYVLGILEETTVDYKGLPEDIVFARTFCYKEEVDLLLSRGLAKGGSLKNAVVIGDGFVYNPEGLRAKDEPLRHKLLDLLGDLSLLGVRIRGKVFSYLGGHTLNYEFVKSLAESSFSTISTSSLVSTP